MEVANTLANNNTETITAIKNLQYSPLELGWACVVNVNEQMPVEVYG